MVPHEAGVLLGFHFTDIEIVVRVGSAPLWQLAFREESVPSFPLNPKWESRFHILQIWVWIMDTETAKNQVESNCA